MRSIINVIGFQAGWFSSVLGAGYGMPWLGMIVVPIVLGVHMFLISGKRAELLLVLISALIGFLFDTILVAAGVFTPVFYLLPAPFSPPWMVMLWINFSITLNISLRGLKGRYFLCALLGAVGGPAAYYSGAQLGALKDFTGAESLLILAIVWSVVVPVLFWIAVAIKRRFSP